MSFDILLKKYQSASFRMRDAPVLPYQDAVKKKLLLLTLRIWKNREDIKTVYLFILTLK